MADLILAAVSVGVRPGRGDAAVPRPVKEYGVHCVIHAHDIAHAGRSELLAIKAAHPDLGKNRSTNMRNLAALAEK